ncbi:MULTISPECIES: type A chloramphenicol O-acetyltransferase [Virgibacillus]|uniref:Chloramphenicol acetyltransferase n=1 Tax=Virgibacillus dokdonensis TaxID=302167 RepID=A0A2K9J2K4_9BACI|nr:MULTISPECIES: type A chloramphenicol O-acetyltransferase [Virgibacillus]AUJ26096.1 Chloramphenicol acetyltransferase [Virgibacillus dokdonensis]NWO13656.1 type A chloramphenicol O-acetyltransferase [Virgibacillus sp.]
MFHIVNRKEWKREAYFNHFSQLRCTFSMTANINITELLKQTRERKMKLYPALIYMGSKVVNQHSEFRMSYNDKGELGYWEVLHPSYSIFHKEEELFSNVWTNFSNIFVEFYNRFMQDSVDYGDHPRLQAKGNPPTNIHPISIIPWTSFTGFNLNINNEGNFLLPIITWGKYFKEAESVFIPLSVQVHHAVCDGYHSSLLINEIQALADRCMDWLDKE